MTTTRALYSGSAGLPLACPSSGKGLIHKPLAGVQQEIQLVQLEQAPDPVRRSDKQQHSASMMEDLPEHQDEAEEALIHVSNGPDIKNH